MIQAQKCATQVKPNSNPKFGSKKILLRIGKRTKNFFQVIAFGLQGNNTEVIA